MLPVRLMNCGLPGALSIILTEALRIPAAVGVKITVIVHWTPGPKKQGQVLVSAKSPAIGSRDADAGDGLRVITVGERDGLRRARGAEALGRENEAGRIESDSLQNADLGDEGIAVATIGGLERIRQREVEGARLARDVGAQTVSPHTTQDRARVESDAVAGVGVAAAQISRVDQRAYRWDSVR